MPRGRRVEDDVIELGRRRGVAEESRELVERGDLDGAGTGELLLHAPHRGVGKDAPVRPDHPLPVRPGRGLGVDVHREEAGDLRDRRRPHPQLDTEDLIEIRGRVGAHEQHPLAFVRETDRRGAGDRGLAHAPFAGEEEIPSDWSSE